MAFMMRLLLASLWLVTITQATSEPRSIVIEVQRTLAKRDDARRISDYIQMSSEELKKALPFLNKDGKTQNCYTFFAPTSSSFFGVLPQDIGDPFFSDNEFRLKMLLRHFSPTCVTKEELKKMTTLTMADSKSVKITQEGESSKINEGDIVSEAIQLDDGFGNVFMIDRVFVTHEEVSESITKHPGPSIGFIPPQDPASRKVRQGLPGGYSEAKVDDTNVKEMASFAASQIAAKSNSGPLKVIEIASAATQVVAGTNYKLVLKLVDAAKNENPQTCEVVVFDQVWTKTRELTSSTCNPGSATVAKEDKIEETVASDPQTKPEEPIRLAGGYSDVPVDDSDVVEFSSWAADQITAKQNVKSPLKVVKVKSAAKQIVSGFNLKMVLELADPTSNDFAQTCNVVVYRQPWTDTTKLTDSSCECSTCDPAAATSTKTKREDIKIEEAVASDPQTNKPISLGSKATESRSVVIQIQEALAKRDDTGRISDYIDMSSEELKKALPWFKEDGTTPNCYTFFAPTSDAFLRTLPQDVGDPFVTDAEFRLVMLLRHFSRPCVTREALKKMTTLTSVDSKSIEITQDDGISKINKADLVSDPIKLGDGPSNIMMIDTVFVSQDEVNAIIAKHPGPSIGSFPVPVDGGYSDVPVDDSDVVEFSSWAADQITAKQNAKTPLKVIKVKSAAKQIVSGFNLKMVLELADPASNDLSQTCEVIIYRQSWTDTTRLTDENCKKLEATKPAVLSVSQNEEAAPEPEAEPSSRLTREDKVGGYTVASVDEKDVKEMGDFAAKQIAAESDSGPLTVIEITSAFTQVVAGKNYKLGLKLVDASNAKPQTCEVVIFDQSWSGTRELKSSTCNPDAATSTKTKREEIKVEEAVASDPQAISKPTPLIVGGYSIVPVDDPEIETVANWAAAKISAQSNSKTPAKVTKIISAATQVVAGKNYKILMELDAQTCKVLIFQSLKNDFELKNSDCNNPEEATKSAATGATQPDDEPAPEPEPSNKATRLSKRQLKKDTSDPTTEVIGGGNKAGGFSSVPIDDPEVEVVANWAAAKIAAKTNSKDPVKVTKIKSAATQVVAGRNYKIVMELDAQTCDVVVFQSLKNDFELKESSCKPDGAIATKPAAKQDPEPIKTPIRPARQIPGAYNDVKVDDDDVKDIANFAALQLAANTNSGPVSVIKIDSAAKQIVAGTNYKLTLHLEKKGVKTTEEDSLICQVIVFESLTKTRKLSESRCGPEIVDETQTKTTAHKTKQ